MKTARKLPLWQIFAAAIFLMIAAALIWKASLSSGNRDRLKAIAARGEPIDGATLNKFYKAVPESENAALLWLAGVDSSHPHPSNSTAWVEITPSRRRALTEQQLVRARELVASNEQAFAIFRRAAALPKSRYPVDLSQGIVTDFSHLTKVKSAAQILQVEAIVATEAGDGKRAADAASTILAAGRSLESAPILLCQLVRYAADAIAFNAANFVLNRISLSDSELIQLQTAFSQADDPESLPRALIGERASFAYHIRDHQSTIRTTAEESGSSIFARLFPMIGFLERDLGFGIDTLTTNIALARMPDPHKFLSRTNLDQAAARASSRYYILSGLFLPGLSKAFARDALHRAQSRVAQAALAVERYRLANNGNLPASLASLAPKYFPAVPVDPFDGQPVRFKNLEAGYVVHSVGPDGKDEGGLEKLPKAREKDPWDLTFTVERAGGRMDNPKPPNRTSQADR